MTFTLGTFVEGSDEEFAGLVDGSTVVRVEAVPGAPRGTISDLLQNWDENFQYLEALATNLRAVDLGAMYDISQLRVMPPLRPGQLLQAGGNYRRHVIELSVALRRGEAGTHDDEELRAQVTREIDERVASGAPYVFIGLPSAICGPYDDVILPRDGVQHDWELEVGLVIGKSAYRVSRDRAMEYVAGYTMCNDLTTRDRVQRPDMPGVGTDWLRSKNAPTFFPTGPYLLPSAFVADPRTLRIVLRLNGQVMQDDTTADMLFDIPQVVEYTSSIIRLQPGDLLLTGSPAGNGAQWGRFLQPGDVMEGEITGLGLQRTRCVAEA